jgi:RimJ/RimL family protein N-acetyltransferase
VSGVSIRPAGPDDFDDWVELFEAVAAEGTWLGSEAPFDRDARRRGYDQTMADPDAAIFLAQPAQSGEPGQARAGGGQVGQIYIRVDPSGVADLGMAVADGFRGQGVGGALMEAAIDFAREHGAHKVTLQVWPHNARAIALYERFGFEHEGRLRRHWRRRNGELWDALVMALVLDTASPGSPH